MEGRAPGGLPDPLDARAFACLGVQGVFRVNLATVVFFLSNWVGCRLAKRYHNGLWIVKVVVYFASVRRADVGRVARFVPRSPRG